MNGAIDGAALLVDVVHALDCLAIPVRRRQVVDHVNPLDDQYSLLQLDVAGDIRPELLRLDLARSQRADKCPGQSAAGRGDDVVERAGVLLEFARLDPVMLGKSTV